jgi:hypothetical protein
MSYRARIVGTGGKVEVPSPEDTQLGLIVTREKYQGKKWLQFGHNGV